VVVLDGAVAKPATSFESGTMPCHAQANATRINQPGSEGAEAKRSTGQPAPRELPEFSRDTLEGISALDELIAEIVRSALRGKSTHHLRFAQAKGVGLKVSDEFTVPLYATHHSENYRTGSEPKWWEAYKIEPLSIAHQLWTRSQQLQVAPTVAADPNAQDLRSDSGE